MELPHKKLQTIKDEINKPKQRKWRGYGKKKKTEKQLPDRIRVKYDPEANAAYVKVRDGLVAESKRFDERIILDYDLQGAVVGIEVVGGKLNDEERKDETVGELGDD